MARQILRIAAAGLGVASHTRMLWSGLAVVSVCPSGLNATASTVLVCPESVASVPPVAVSHRRRV